MGPWPFAQGVPAQPRKLRSNNPRRSCNRHFLAVARKRDRRASNPEGFETPGLGLSNPKEPKLRKVVPFEPKKNKNTHWQATA